MNPPLHSLAGKRVLLIIGGGIAAYKSLELIRLLKAQGCAVTCVLTDSGAQFVTPLSLAALSENPVYTALFSLKDETEMGHIRLSREADLIVVCPATANLMARMAAGIADDLATTVLMATDTPVLAVPAMNVRMWTHAATQRNLAQLRADGITVMQPDDGAMACGEFGPGRLPEPAVIVEHIARALEPAAQGRLTGRHVLVTAGPTHEAIDPVRYIANRSSGKQGFAVAAALADEGARVTLVAGPVNLPTPPGVDRIDVVSARDMAAACAAALPADVAICVAAVADWHVAPQPQKIKKQGDGAPALTLIENPDILKTLSQLPKPGRPQLVIGFAAETEDVLAHAHAKRARKRCDWIIANDVSPETGIMGGDMTTVHLVSADTTETWADLAKTAVASRLAGRIADALDG